MYTFRIKNLQIYFLFFVFFFLCLCFCFLSCLVFFKQQIFLNSRLIIGGQKRGFAPHPNYWGARARAAPQSLRLWSEAGDNILDTIIQS